MYSEGQIKKNKPICLDPLLSLTEINKSKIFKLVVTLLKIFVNLICS